MRTWEEGVKKSKKLSRCWHKAPSTKSVRVSQTIPYLLTISYYLRATLPPSTKSLTKPTGLSKNFNFFIFQLFQKIISRGRSPGCLRQSLKISPRLPQSSLRSFTTHNYICLPFTHPLPKARSLCSLAFDMPPWVKGSVCLVL